MQDCISQTKKLDCYKNIFFLNKRQCHLVFSQMTSSEWLISIQYSAFKTPRPIAHPYNIQLLYGFAPLGRQSQHGEQNKSPSFPFEASTTHELHHEVTDNSTVSESNNRSLWAQSKESPFDVLLISHIRETHSSCSPY